MSEINETRVVNINKESYDIYIGRAGRGQDGYIGNPVRLERGALKGSTLEAYKTYFMNRLDNDPQFKQKVHELKGKTLGCFCKPGLVTEIS